MNMMRFFKFVPAAVFLTAVFLSGPTLASAKGWAVLVGIDQYHSAGINPLAGSVNDARQLGKTLQEVFDIPEKQVLIYTSDADAAHWPSTGRIVQTLQYVAERAASDDLFVFSFSGHGISAEGKSYLLTYYSEMGALTDTALSMDRLMELMTDIRSRKRLMIIDACRNDPEKGRGQTPNLMTADFARSIGVHASPSAGGRIAAVLFSCEIGQRAYEWPERGRGFFSCFLEEGLKGKAADASGRVTLGSLVGYLQRSVPDALQQTVGVNLIQTPYAVMEGGDPASWVLVEMGGRDWEAEVTRRQRELSDLEKLQATQDAARKAASAEEAAYAKKLADMDAQIDAMKRRLNTNAARTGDSLDTMLSMVADKDAEARKMAALKKQREAEERQRQAEIQRLQAEKFRKQMAAFEADAAKYQQIVSSPYGKDMAEAAWRQIAAKYPEAAQGVNAGDIEAMKSYFYGLAPYMNALGMEFVYIPPGTFMMGSPSGLFSGESGRDSDETQHRVTLTQGCYLQTTEVTQGQWNDVMGRNPSYFKNCGNDCPVEQVSWNDVQEFIRRLNQREGTNKYRLPTEAEWEYACRAGSETAYCYGDSQGGLGGYAWYSDNSDSKTHPAGQKQPNAWGLYDMHGNVWEWCQDWCGDYPSGAVTDPEGPSSGGYRVFRGGSWYCNTLYCRSAFRYWSSPDLRSLILGFRLAFSPGQQGE
jgi:formylglycine-generating enzyme required for sulfatase activity